MEPTLGGGGSTPPDLGDVAALDTWLLEATGAGAPVE
jgi:hypothetical protein